MSAVLVALLLIAVIGGFFMLSGLRPDVRGPEARELVAAGARLVDVRSPAEFAAGHLPGAVNVPLGELARRMAKLGAKDAPIVLYCASGARSAHAKRLLAAGGFTRVRNLGPMGAW